MRYGCGTMTSGTLDPNAVVAFAAAAGIPLADPEAAARLAAGAQAAIEAVRSAGNATLFDHEPSDFLPTLERLAHRDTL